ncbi:MAG: YggS family pyridoxal phosphate-dependent enzyme [Sphingobacteriia bacterium]|nr:MAG: YggS family pyridoxal phosphate-dependent enzyme [Sphingobacteriia bacterium]
MAVNTEFYQSLVAQLPPEVQLVAVSKTKPNNDIQALYDLGQRDFGENYVQELVDKSAQLPQDIRWHFIGHLQSNKVKYLAPFVHLIQGVDSLKLLLEINKQANKLGRVIPVLLQMHIAQEESKFGMDAAELEQAVEAAQNLSGVRVDGLMGMASFTHNLDQVKEEFTRLKYQYDALNKGRFRCLSMGMSGDYALAIAAGSTCVRIGSLLFGSRN